MPKFKTTVMQAEGMNATGIVVPDEIMEKLGAGKKPKVSVTLKSYTYRSTIAVMGGKFMLPLAREHRDAAGVKGGDKVEVALELDTAPREVEVPKDFAVALKKAGLTKDFAALAFTHRKEHVRAIEEAKAPETRLRRIEKAVGMVQAKKK
ncbi:MAG: YdeI/OmpD-associated family protein [Hyphomonadaceae bacterium]|nr:YdeI/OmpD-associated family protein [Hyphomonadaceae bacterium]